eukprot:CAMPEP_0197659184 /NCGR_PEP_ID=MMETSP1338-20131121/46509_1 /TAXON_ID=43686 ORGANISM="Pelagodinium beii, Strain RCC1491" /NCGR_SAMPLE_ID=MMETSP1338 /ASSEMBLY_ACC=CAM_ASM_000754 /LENGTH=228 /DNA_ID=CAMNT_0043235977 /DNA_START=234 /DNA_END=920 /DNA_ORIENTATION=-
MPYIDCSGAQPAAQAPLPAACQPGTPVSASTVIMILGDSITGAGQSGAPDPYPAKLQRLLGSEFFVMNFGCGYATMQNTTNAYASSPQWTAVHSAQLGPSPSFICIIQLGSNDAQAQFWNPAGYKSAYLEMISALKKQAPQARVVLSIPPPLGMDGACAQMSKQAIDQELPRIITEISHEAGLEDPIKTNEAFQGENLAALLPDGCHPADAGHSKIAQAFKTHLLYGR